jgi:hypothetical protein
MVGFKAKYEHQKHMRHKEIKLHAQNQLTILDRIVNINQEQLFDHLITQNSSLNKVEDIHMSSENHQARRSGHDMELLIISHKVHVSCSNKECRKESVCLIPAYLMFPL